MLSAFLFSVVIYVLLALEAQTFSIESPAMFFSMFAPSRNAQARARERLLEDLRFTARHVRPFSHYHSLLHRLLTHLTHTYI